MKILILDDHALFRDGLNYLLKAMDQEIVLLQAASVVQAQTLLEKHPDIELFLIDLDMPIHNGFEALQMFSKLYMTLPCVILSASNKRSDVNKALELGALGFISKSTHGEALHTAIKLILAGEIYVPYDIMHSERRVNRNTEINLTDRQLQVMALVRQGCPNKIIADKLCLAESTVKMHLSTIFEKLNVHNRTAAIEQISQLNINLPDIN